MTEQESRLLALWLARPSNGRTAVDAIEFYGWVKQNHPSLLDGFKVDPMQRLRSLLQDHTQP